MSFSSSVRSGNWGRSWRSPRPSGTGWLAKECAGHDVGKRAAGEQGVPKTPRYILWGEGTTDEMCLGILLVTD